MSELERHPAKKGRCPHCGRPRKWRYFVGHHGDDRYGKCDRVNNCPSMGKIYYPNDRVSKIITPIKEPIKKILYIPQLVMDEAMQNMDTNFHRFCYKLGIDKKHLIKWGVGGKDDKTIFFFIDKDNHIVNRKIGKYSIDGKRDKSYGYYSMKQPSKEYRYMLCLYGEHLITDKPIAIVESEKSAVIASWIYPEYDWVACGSASGLSNGDRGTSDKISILKGKKVLWFCDADKAGRENSSLKNLELAKIHFHIVDLFPMRNDGYDIADAIVDKEQIEL